MYMGLKIYGNMKHGTHETLIASPSSLNLKPKKFSIFFISFLLLGHESIVKLGIRSTFVLL